MQINGHVIRLTFLGGAFGTVLRFLFFIALGDLFSVILVNLLGASLLGWFNGNSKTETEFFNSFWKIGFAGGFTTMSGFASLIFLYTQGLGLAAIAAALAITVLGLGGYWLAFKISRDRARY